MSTLTKFFQNATLIFLLCLTTQVEAKDKKYYSYTELQIHAETNRQPSDSDIFTGTFEHFSKWKYGDNFFFLDSEEKPNFKAESDTLYYEYASRFSLDKIFDKKLLPSKYLGDLYTTIQYNDGDKDFINRVWLYGLSMDFAGQPNFGFSNIHFLIRQEETQDTSYQLTFVWGQPFTIGNLKLKFQGFMDYWEDDNRNVFLTEPQLRLSLSNIVGKDSFLSNADIGTEIEISKDFFGKGYGWETNPTIFISFPLE